MTQLKHEGLILICSFIQSEYFKVKAYQKESIYKLSSKEVKGKLKGSKDVLRKEENKISEEEVK